MACEFPFRELAVLTESSPLTATTPRFEVPSNIVLKIVRPSLWMSILLFSWGIVMTLMGIVKTYEGLLATRFFLGLAEAGFFPAST